MAFSAALLSSLAAILNALAWPAVALWFLAIHRKKIALLLEVFGSKLSSAKKLKFGQFELEEIIQTEVEDAAEQVSAQPVDDHLPKSIPGTQVAAAKRLKEKVNETSIPNEVVLESVRQEIYRLANEYETARGTMPSGHLRTRRMNEIAAGMRTLALAGLSLRTELTKSASAGKRLAAICILQVEPRPRYFSWLIQRVKTESQPFIFYQAAVAILEMARKNLFVNSTQARSEIIDAIRVISNFKGGQPDQNTIDALNEALLIHP